jgi:hypothetical protein
VVRIDPSDYIGHNPGFESRKDVVEYMEAYDKMKKHSSLNVSSENVESEIELTDAKIRCEKYVINARELLQEYGQFIDFSKVDYTFDQLIKMQKSAIDAVHEVGEDDVDHAMEIFEIDEYTSLETAMNDCLSSSGLSVMGWEIEEHSEDSKNLRHSSSEEDEGE